MWLRLATHASVGIIAAYQAAYRLHGDNMQNEFYRRRALPDLLERKGAIDTALESNVAAWLRQPELRRALMKPLARQAVAKASASLDDEDLELFSELARLAQDLDPAIRATLPWARLWGKRHVGPDVTRVARSIVARLRRGTTRTAQG
jgi:hypothetical protein